MEARREITEAEWRALDRARARRIYVYSAVSSAVLTAILYIL